MFNNIKIGFSRQLGRFLFYLFFGFIISIIVFLISSCKANAWSMATAGNITCNNGHVDYTNPSNANWRSTSGMYGNPAVQWFKTLYNVDSNAYCYTNLEFNHSNPRYISYIDFDHDGSNEVLHEFGDNVAVSFYNLMRETAGSSLTTAPPNEPTTCQLFIYDYGGNFLSNGPSCHIEVSRINDDPNQDSSYLATWYYNAVIDGPYTLQTGCVYKIRVNFKTNYYPAQLGTWSYLSVKEFSTTESEYVGSSVSNSNYDCGVVCKLTHLPATIWGYFSNGFTSIISGITNLPSLIWNALSGGFSNIVNAVNSVSTGVGNIGSYVWNGISSGLGTLLTNLGNFIKSIFIPDNFTWSGLWTNTLQPIYNDFVDKLGIIGLPFHIIQKFYDAFSNITTSNTYIISIPEIKDPFYNVTIINSTSIDLKSFVSSGIMQTIYNIYLVTVDAVVIFAVSRFSYSKFQDIFEG